jgi:hypothetical protein
MLPVILANVGTLRRLSRSPKRRRWLADTLVVFIAVERSLPLWPRGSSIAEDGESG